VRGLTPLRKGTMSSLGAGLKRRSDHWLGSRMTMRSRPSSTRRL